MAQDNNGNSLETRMALVEKELDTVYGVFQRLETALERITDLSSSVKEILAVHDARLLERERADVTIFETIEKRKEEQERGIEKLYSKLEEMKSEIRQEIRDHLDNNKNLSDKIDQRFDAQNTRIQKLERWRWIMLGGGTVIGFLLGAAEQILSWLPHH